MRLNDIPANRIALDLVEKELLRKQRQKRKKEQQRLLRKIKRRIANGVRTLLVWHFGPTWEKHSPYEIPAREMRHFRSHYAPKAA